MSRAYYLEERTFFKGLGKIGYPQTQKHNDLKLRSLMLLKTKRDKFKK